MKPVLFVTGLGKQIDRAENINVLFNAYKGDKKLITMCEPTQYYEEVFSGKYGVQVCDIFPVATPGKSIMLWHSIQGGKYIGLDEKGTYYKEEYLKFLDCIIAAGHGAIDMFHQCTHLPKDKILNLGMPRTDRYIGKKKGDGSTIMAKKKAYLYAPTFRQPSETPLPMVDYEYLDSKLTDDEILVVKHHPQTPKMDINGYKHIVEVWGMEPSVNYLYDCDVLITDYSSIMFDAYLLKKPVVLFEKRPGYTETRGMYLHYPDQYCSRYVTSERLLIRAIRSAKRLGQIEKDCRKLVADACDGHSCERICKLIYNLMEE